MRNIETGGPGAFQSEAKINPYLKYGALYVAGGALFLGVATLLFNFFDIVGSGGVVVEDR